MRGIDKSSAIQPRGKQVAGIGWQEGWLDADAPTSLADFLQVLDGEPGGILRAPCRRMHGGRPEWIVLVLCALHAVPT